MSKQLGLHAPWAMLCGHPLFHHILGRRERQEGRQALLTCLHCTVCKCTALPIAPIVGSLCTMLQECSNYQHQKLCFPSLPLQAWAGIKSQRREPGDARYWAMRAEVAGWEPRNYLLPTCSLGSTSWTALIYMVLPFVFWFTAQTWLICVPIDLSCWIYKSRFNSFRYCT